MEKRFAVHFHKHFGKIKMLFNNTNFQKCQFFFSQNNYPNEFLKEFWLEKIEKIFLKKFLKILKSFLILKFWLNSSLFWEMKKLNFFLFFLLFLFLFFFFWKNFSLFGKNEFWWNNNANWFIYVKNWDKIGIMVIDEYFISFVKYFFFEYYF